MSTFKQIFDEIWTSVVRTLSPILVGFILTLGVKAGVDIDSQSAVALVQAVMTFVYYVFVRVIETYKPKFGILLGKAKKPTY